MCGKSDFARHEFKISWLQSIDFIYFSVKKQKREIQQNGKMVICGVYLHGIGLSSI
jgi:hypothetical protein